MTRTTALLFAALAITSCDNASEDAEPRTASLELDDADDADDADDVEAAPTPERTFGRERGHHGKRGHEGRHDPSGQICEVVSCSEAQLEQVKAAFASPERREHGERHERPDMSAANAALAQAFAGDGFSEADLKTWAARLPERPDHADGGERHLQTMSELHTILDAAQRKTLAETITVGEMFGKPRCNHEGSDHRTRMLEHFCEPLACTDAQKTELTAVFDQRHDGPDREALAAAFVADTFDADAVAGLMERRPEHVNATLVAVHGVLTAEQRATLAERIAERGPWALLGKGGKHGKRGRHGKRRGKRGGERELADEAREFG